MQREIFFPTVDRCIASATSQGLLIAMGWTIGISIADAKRYASHYRTGRQSPSAGFFEHEGRMILSHGPAKITMEKAAALAIIELIEAAYSEPDPESEYRRFLQKVRDAYHGGEDAWSVQSTGEKLAVALALNRQDWLARMGYTMAEAIDRVGEVWSGFLARAAREVLEE